MGKGRVIITGANRGLGRAFAIRCAREGYDLTLVARDTGLLKKCAGEISGIAPVPVETMSVDLSDADQVKELARDLSSRDDIVMLINNAGFAIPEEFCDCDIDLQLTMIRVHDEASLRLARAVLPSMKRRGKGVIINVASTLAYIPFVSNSVYCASKAFINVFSEVLQREVRRYGITVQALNPGMTKTDFHSTEVFKKVKSFKKNVREMEPEQVVDHSFRKLGKRLIAIPGVDNLLMAGFGNFVGDMIMRRKGMLSPNRNALSTGTGWSSLYRPVRPLSTLKKVVSRKHPVLISISVFCQKRFRLFRVSR